MLGAAKNLGIQPGEISVMYSLFLKAGSRTIAIAVSVAFFLAACGGGGSGNSTATTTPPDQSNRAPVADSGGPYTGTAGTAINFDGSGSSDADNDALTYQWNFGDGNSGVGVTPSHTYSTEGSYTVSLTVSDGSATSAASTTTATITRPATGYSAGIVSGFGSVVVNGTRYEIEAGTTTITDDDSSIEESALEIGDFVLIKALIGDNDIRTADTIDVDEAVEGIVFSVQLGTDDKNTGSLIVMGQEVRTTELGTTFADDSDLETLKSILDLGALASGPCVEVAGLTDPLNGVIMASRVELRPCFSDVFEVRGAVDSVGVNSFAINGLTVLSAPGAIEAGDFVEVKGSYDGVTVQTGTTGEFTPSIVEPISGTLDDNLADNDEAEVQGYVINCPDVGDCTNFTVQASPSIVVPVRLQTPVSGVTFEPAGFQLSDIANGARLEAEGVFSAGSLVANKINLRPKHDSRIEAVIEAVDFENSTITALGVTFNIDNGVTRVEDKRDDIADFTIAQLVPGVDYIRVEGFEGRVAIDEVSATALERQAGDGSDRVILQGFVNSQAGDSIDVLGVTVVVDAATECQQADDSAYPGGCPALLTDLVDNQTIVKVRGANGASYDSGTRALTAEQVEIELPDN